MGNKKQVRKPRIIVFDDDTVFLKALERYFSMKNYEVRCFNQPILCTPCENSCINICADIIIADFDMRLINGIELLNRQLQKGCPIDIKNKAIMSGVLSNVEAYTFFRKPFPASEIDDWIKERVGSFVLETPLHKTYLDS